MDREFRDWIMKNNFGWTESEPDKQKKKIFVQTLKFEPDKVKKWIFNEMHGWGMYYVLFSESGRLHQNLDSDSDQLLLFLQEHFATELATIT